MKTAKKILTATAVTAFSFSLGFGQTTGPSDSSRERQPDSTIRQNQSETATGERREAREPRGSTVDPGAVQQFPPPSTPRRPEPREDVRQPQAGATDERSGTARDGAIPQPGVRQPQEGRAPQQPGFGRSPSPTRDRQPLIGPLDGQPPLSGPADDEPGFGERQQQQVPPLGEQDDPREFGNRRPLDEDVPPTDEEDERDRDRTDEDGRRSVEPGERGVRPAVPRRDGLPLPDVVPPVRQREVPRSGPRELPPAQAQPPEEPNVGRVPQDPLPRERLGRPGDTRQRQPLDQGRTLPRSDRSGSSGTSGSSTSSSTRSGTSSEGGGTDSSGGGGTGDS